MHLNLITALGEIRMHRKVSMIDFPHMNELHVKFTDTFADLVIPITPDIDTYLLVNIFYNYLKHPESKLTVA